MGFKLISLLLLFLPLLTITILSGTKLALASDKTLLLNIPHRNSTAASGDGGNSSLRGKKQTRGCNLFQGRWVFDASYPFYDSSSCPFIDGEFDCLKFGRPDKQFLKYSWQPEACTIPRFSTLLTHMFSIFSMYNSKVFNKNNIIELNQFSYTRIWLDGILKISLPLHYLANFLIFKM